MLAAQNEKPAVADAASIKEVILEMTAKRLGTAVVVDAQHRVLGIGAALPQPGMGAGGPPTSDLAQYAEGVTLDRALSAAARAAQGLPVSA